MCMFSQPVISVNNTQIFARISSAGTHFLAYQMNYESHEENAMILPIPVRQPVRDDSLKFIDLQGYAHFFADLAQGFPFSAPRSLGCSAAVAPAACASLQVFEVGNYVASFVPSVADFVRLDKRFCLPEETWSHLPQYKAFGFAVFQLAAGLLTPHPMAFEFESDKKSLFFPTLHIHDGEIHEAEEFDHVLYLQHAGFDSRVYGYQNSHTPDGSTGLVRSKYVAKHFCEIAKCKGIVNADLLVHRRTIRGSSRNQDTEIAALGDPTRPSLNLRALTSYAPWAIVAAGITWFFARRGKLKKMKTSADTTETDNAAE